MVLTRDEVPAATKKAMIRASLMTMAALGGMGLLLIALVDGWLTGRRDPDPEDLAVDDEPGHHAAACRCTPCTRTSRHLTGPTPDRAAPAAVTARLVKRRRRRDERGEAS